VEKRAGRRADGVWHTHAWFKSAPTWCVAVSGANENEMCWDSVGWTEGAEWGRRRCARAAAQPSGAAAAVTGAAAMWGGQRWSAPLTAVQCCPCRLHCSRCSCFAPSRAEMALSLCDAHGVGTEWYCTVLCLQQQHQLAAQRQRYRVFIDSSCCMICWAVGRSAASRLMQRVMRSAASCGG